MGKQDNAKVYILPCLDFGDPYFVVYTLPKNVLDPRSSGIFSGNRVDIRTASVVVVVIAALFQFQIIRVHNEIPSTARTQWSLALLHQPLFNTHLVKDMLTQFIGRPNHIGSDFKCTKTNGKVKPIVVGFGREFNNYFEYQM